MQPEQPPLKPLEMEPFLQSLNQKLGNMKRQNAQQLGIMVQTQSEQIGRQHDTLIQEIAPLVQEVGRLNEVKTKLEVEISILKKRITSGHTQWLEHFIFNR